jgi:uncharacterized protein YoxC
MNNETIQLACIALIALGVLVQTILLTALFFGVGKGLIALKEEIEDLKSSMLPKVEKTQALLEKASQLVEKSNGFVERVGPKIEATATDVAALVSGIRNQAAEVEAALSEVLRKVEKQSARLDTMFSGTLDAVDKAGAYVTHTVAKPVRQFSGLVAGFKAAVESLRYNNHPTRESAIRDDKDMFI